MGKKDKCWKKILWIFVLVVVFGIAVGQTSYAKGKNGWSGKYYYVNGVKQKKTWIEDKNGTFYVDSSGKKVTGWKKIDGRYYFLNEKGKLYNKNKKTGVRLSKLSENVITMGIDMSQWQGSVDWNKIRASGVDFVMLRLGYGKGRYGSKSCTLDTKFEEYVKGAQEVGIPIGIYFYSYAKNTKQALAEAEYTIKQLKGIEVSFPVAYDIEDSAIVNATNTKTRTEMAKTYMDTIKAAGYTPMFYCNQNWYENYLNAEELEDYDFWYARYTYVEPDRTVYPCGIWQATSTQKLNGITENTVDVNFLYEDYFTTVKTRSQPLKYGWHKEDGNWHYYYRGKSDKNGWFTLAGNSYYLENGIAATGWKELSGETYYFNESGKMQTGFIKVDGRTYKLDSKGVLQRTTTQPGVTIREDGSWEYQKGWFQNSKGKWYYQYNSGSIAKNKWITQNKKKYYCDKNGYRVTGFVKIEGKQYYFQKNGVMKTGWLKYSGKKYYFKSNGQMVKNKTIKLKGKRYKFNKKGQLVN